jgi:cholest-4-en-3-one 26-monooxygenase
MASPNLPDGFDPTDPDLCVKGLPVDEWAELRKTQPIWWCEQPIGKAGGFNDGGYWRCRGAATSSPATKTA